MHQMAEGLCNSLDEIQQRRASPMPSVCLPAHGTRAVPAHGGLAKVCDRVRCAWQLGAERERFGAGGDRIRPKISTNKTHLPGAATRSPRGYLSVPPDSSLS